MNVFFGRNVRPVTMTAMRRLMIRMMMKKRVMILSEADGVEGQAGH